MHFAADAESVVRDHRAYNRVVRRVAEATGSHLLDLEAIFEGRSEVDRIFMADGIHFTEYGHEVAGRCVAGFIEREVL